MEWKIHSILLSDDEQKIVGINFEITSGDNEHAVGGTVKFPEPPNFEGATEESILQLLFDTLGDDAKAEHEAMLKSAADNVPPIAYPWPFKSKSTMIAEQARRTREDIFMFEVDPIICNPIRWAELSTEKQNEWKQFRLDLLDISKQSGFPENITWPTKP